MERYSFSQAETEADIIRNKAQKAKEERVADGENEGEPTVLDYDNAEKSLEPAKQREINQQELESKIVDEIKISEIRSKLGVEQNQNQIAAFLAELPNENGFIDFTQFKKIGRGGTHDVFIFPDTSSVIKLNRGILEKILTTGQSSLSPEMRQSAEQLVKDENTKYDQLYQYFGKKNCLHERMLIQKIKVESGDNTKELEALISIQESSEVFKNPNKKDFSTSYAEKNLTEQNKEIYTKMNNALLGNGEFNEDDFLQFNDKLRPIFELIGNDKNFEKSMQEFLLRFKEYFSISGKFIDLVGEENVLFYQKEGKWNFQLGSVLKAESRKNVEDALEILEKNPELLDSGHQKGNLLNGLALIRLFNAVGIKTGIGKVVDIQLSKNQLNNLERVKFE